MEKEQLIQELKEKHSAFVDYLRTLNDEEFTASFSSKWSPGQQLVHILLSVKPLVQVFVLPQFVLRLVFGKPKQKSLSYEGLVDKYHKVLENGGKASSKYVPNEVSATKKEAILKSLTKVVDEITAKLKKMKNEELDTVYLPHPLIGKVTLREMMYFTIYHVQHHHKMTKENGI